MSEDTRPLRALITGGEGDLARATAKTLRTQGWEVLAPGRSTLDVSDPASVERCFASIDHLDYLICAAGCTRDAPLPRLSEADWETVIAVNLKGAHRCAHAAWELLGTSRGSIALIGSHAGRAGTPGQTAYAAAKAGLEGLARELASEGGPLGVRANLVLPGFLDTRMTNAMSPKRREEVRTHHLLGEFNSVATAARFLAFLPTLPATSGQVFNLDSRL